MPLYEYRCEANGEIVEVVHRMADKFTTWGQVCEHMKRDAGRRAGRRRCDQTDRLG